jgi:glucose-1-phosphate thymidylyltransferase
MKGIVLAGGNGTRLSPLTTVVSKQLLPVYNKPMIYYPLDTLKKLHIKDVLIITKPEDRALFEKQLGDGSQFGMNFTFYIQRKPSGLPEAFIIGEDFIGNDSVALILGDNVFIGHPGNPFVNNVFGYKVTNPEQYGVFDFKNHKIVEKPKEHVSDWACVGLYVFDNTCVEKAKNLKPSARGELEIADLINSYDEVKFSKLRDHVAWFDCGTFDDLNECSNYIRALKKRTNIGVGL